MVVGRRRPIPGGAGEDDTQGGYKHVNHPRRTARRGAVLFSLLLVAAACGSDDDGGGAADTTAAGAETTAAGEETTAPPETGGETTTAVAARRRVGRAGRRRSSTVRAPWRSRPRSTRRLTRRWWPRASRSCSPCRTSRATPAAPSPTCARARRPPSSSSTSSSAASAPTTRPARPAVRSSSRSARTSSHRRRPSAAPTRSWGADPNLIQIGVDFFTPAMYPIFQGIPTLQTLPIFVADFDQAGVYSGIGGCPTAFISAAQFMVEFQKFDKLAIPYANNAPGNQCWTDTQERFYQYYTDQGVWEFEGFPDEPGDPSDNAALIQNVADFLEGAENPGVFFGVQSSDCVEFLKGLSRRRRRRRDRGVDRLRGRHGARPARERGDVRRAPGLQRGRPGLPHGLRELRARCAGRCASPPMGPRPRCRPS